MLKKNYLTLLLIDNIQQLINETETTFSTAIAVGKENKEYISSKEILSLLLLKLYNFKRVVDDVMNDNEKVDEFYEEKITELKEKVAKNGWNKID